jgi:hypothetical protein
VSLLLIVAAERLELVRPTIVGILAMRNRAR